MATSADGWNGFIGGIKDLAGAAGAVGDAVNAWKKTTPDIGGSNTASNNSSLDNLAASLSQSTESNKKLLIIGGIGLAVALGLFLVLKK